MNEQRHYSTARLLALLTVFTLIVGCSNHAWYEGMRSSTRHECLKTQGNCPPGPEYDQYKQQRDELKKDKN